MHLPLAVVLSALAAAGVRADEPITPAALGPRTVRLTYEARVTPPEGTRVLELWLPVPREEEQAVLELRLAGAARPSVVHLTPSGDRAAYLRVAAPKGTVTLTETATVSRREVRAPLAASHASPADIDAATYDAELDSASRVIRITDEVRAIARRETAGPVRFGNNPRFSTRARPPDERRSSRPRTSPSLTPFPATGKPVVLMLFSGRPITLPWAFQHVPAVMAAWFPGIQAGPALVRTLFGDANPSGRLTVSWPRSVGQEPLYYNALSTGRPAGKVDLTRPPRTGNEKYVSRYIDEQNSPQFPFGFGMSYTTFRYGNLHVDKTQIGAKSLNEDLLGRETRQSAALSASADVTNTGTHPGVETVQCYLRFQGTSVVISFSGFVLRCAMA